MKKIGLTMMCAICAILLASCGEKDYNAFVGTWGVDKIEYYNIDYAGNPISSTLETYTFDPEDTKNGIQVIFRADKTGEMRDGSLDTLMIDWNNETQEYDSMIVRPDTVLVYTFTYTYVKDESALYMNMKYTYPYVYSRTFMMKVHNLTESSFSYENEYTTNYMEHAYLKKLFGTSSSATSRNKPNRPHKPGSLLSDR